MRLRTPFTDDRVCDLFSSLTADAKAHVYSTWLARRYPRLFRWIPDQRTGLPVWAPPALVAAERIRRGATREALRVVRLPHLWRRQRAYQDDDRQCRDALVRQR